MFAQTALSETRLHGKKETKIRYFSLLFLLYFWRVDDTV